jgi:hypothetical protein
MSQEIVQTLQQKIQTLSPAEQQQVLQFVEAMTSQPKRLRSLVKIDEIVQSVPLEEWEELPVDGAANVDHYLYGNDKQP